MTARWASAALAEQFTIGVDEKVPGLSVTRFGYSRFMDKIWSADELMSMSPAERQELFDANSSTDLASIPERLVELARQDVRAHIRRTEAITALDV